LTFSDLEADISADLIRHGLAVHAPVSGRAAKAAVVCIPHGQYQTAGAWVAPFDPSGVHSRRGTDHVVSRSNRSIGLLLRAKEYVEPRIGRASERSYAKTQRPQTCSSRGIPNRRHP
jgi:hypothetical protein